MKLCSTFFRWIQISLALFAAVLLVKAETARAQPAADGGLQMSVNTEAYRVYAGDPAVAKARARAARPGVQTIKTREALAVSVQFVNRSPYDLRFTFADEASALQRFAFRLFNSKGEEVWNGGGGEAVAAEDAVVATLRKRSRWSTVARIPLKIDGVWLVPGAYTVEASLAGEPKIGATTLFEIAAAPEPQPEQPLNTGIQGQVLSNPGSHITLDGGAIAPAVMPRPVKAAIVVQQILPEGSNAVPFTWQGTTGLDGRFQVNTPPGKFRVQANTKGVDNITVTLPGTLEPSVVVNQPATVPFPSVPPSDTATAEVTVNAGAYSPVQLFVGGGLTFEQPRADTGIKGQIFVPTATNEMVVAPGARVVVEELREGGLFFGVRPRFQWTGVTDAQGRFQVNTPPGKFRVAATWSETPVTGEPRDQTLPFQLSLPLRGTKEVQVTAGSFSEVRLDLRAGLVEIGTRQVSSVSSVELRILPTFAPPSLVEVSAEGMVNSGGWSNAQLRQRQVTPEGIIEFDFVAKPPKGPATQAFQSISAVTRVPQPSNFRGVRVFSQTNRKEAMLQ